MADNRTRRTTCYSDAGGSPSWSPSPRLLCVLPALSLQAVCLLALGGCASPPAAPSPVPQPVPERFLTYTGTVEYPLWGTPNRGRLLSGATVTIVGGRPDGRMAVTDEAGQFVFENYPFCLPHGDECARRRFRVEKAGYETREVRLEDRYWGGPHLSLLVYDWDYKRILLGREWPVDLQLARLRRDLPAVEPYWLVEMPRDLGPAFAAGMYDGGVIYVRDLNDRHTIAHEYCHAHQDWAIDPTNYSNMSVWTDTLEGQAFIAASDADRAWEILSYFFFPSDPPNYIEDAAFICTEYFYEREPPVFGRRFLREHLPHLFAWAGEWLRRR